MAKTLTAGEGKYLYDGENVVKTIRLANDADEQNWQEVTEDFYLEQNVSAEPENEKID